MTNKSDEKKKSDEKEKSDEHKTPSLFFSTQYLADVCSTPMTRPK